MKNPQKTIYKFIEDEYIDKSKVKLPKQFLKKCKAEYNVPQFIPHEVKKKIQQNGLEYGLFSQICED